MAQESWMASSLGRGRAWGEGEDVVQRGWGGRV